MRRKIIVLSRSGKKKSFSNIKSAKQFARSGTWKSPALFKIKGSNIVQYY